MCTRNTYTIVLAFFKPKANRPEIFRTLSYSVTYSVTIKTELGKVVFRSEHVEKLALSLETPQRD
eukprot:4928814-Pyramimonas_sp.AAC.1